ncbi:Rieske 2Fe-2S domain-containing protein, partial [Frankia sp. AgKG'84/4]|uniref:Rieske 2Fe-2S domain-containing protein n=1 Tax=Frankia sp. AgKG'84/4 TaxID=573490 RepID=UPI00202A3100
MPSDDREHPAVSPTAAEPSPCAEPTPRLALVRTVPAVPTPRLPAALLDDGADDAALDRAFISAAARYWHPVARSRDVGQQPWGATLLGVPLVLWRPVASNGVSALVDQCPHRGVPLSAGTVDAEG